MSRSIHRTRRDYAEARAREYADAEQRAAELKKIVEELATKRRIKAQAQSQRGREESALPPLAPEAIPIRVRDEHPHVHYLATPDDIRGVMRLLPKGVLDGLSSIDLCLGLEDQLSPSGWSEGAEADTLLGRVGWELWPGVFSGHVLGVYHPDSARIRLFAYLYDGAMPDRAVKELYLRLQMLSIFVHEVAHHYDCTVRIARGRWRADSEVKLEIYAEKVQHEWVQRYVIPYLEAAYPENLRALDAWISHHGGTSIPLALLAGDPRTTIDGDKIRMHFNVSEAFETLVTDVSKGEPLDATRIGFARELHYGEHYVEALETLERVLADHPEHSEALTLQADISVHQDEFDLAESLCERVLSRDEGYAKAWEVLADSYFWRRDWEKLLYSTDRVLSLLEPADYKWRVALRHRARAHLELGDFAKLETDVQDLMRLGRRHWQCVATAFRAIMLLRTGRAEEALQAAIAGLQDTPVPIDCLSELAAVRFEAAHRLGCPAEAGEFKARYIELLRYRGHEAWMDRLMAEYGVGVTGSDTPDGRGKR